MCVPAPAVAGLKVVPVTPGPLNVPPVGVPDRVWVAPVVVVLVRGDTEADAAVTFIVSVQVSVTALQLGSVTV